VQLRGVKMEPQSFSYWLYRTKEAFDATRECTRRNVEAMRLAGAGGGTADSVAELQADPEGLDARAPSSQALLQLGTTRMEEFEVPGWSGAAFAGAAGAFTHCAIEADYRNGTHLAFLRAADGPLLMTLRRGDWKLSPGSPAPLQYRFGRDDPTKVAAEAIAVDATTLGVDFGTEAAIATQLSETPELVVDTEGRSLSFDISDIGPGLEAVDACAVRHSAAGLGLSASAKVLPPDPSEAAAEPGLRGPQPSGVPPQDDQAENDADLKLEAADITAALLTRLGYADAVLLSPEDTPEFVRDRHTAWQVGQVLGVTDILPAVAIDEIKSDIIRSDDDSCPGRFDSHDLDAASGSRSAYLTTYCDRDNQDTYAFYILVGRPDGGYLHFALTSRGGGSEAGEISRDLYALAAGR
jgi:hypothetical protein